jgi:hypothetical protein
MFSMLYLVIICLQAAGGLMGGTCMPTLVEKLQLDAMDPKVSVTDLLRRVKFTAVQLGLGKVEDWVEQELNGYTGSITPDYRTLYGRPMSHHPYQGWQQIGGAPAWMSKRQNNQAIAALEAMALSATSDTRVHIAFPDEITEKLNKANGTVGWNCDLVVPVSEIVRILDKVRNLVLDWALNLQKANILGSEMSFNQTEKDKAQAASTTINIGSIGNFAGNIGQGNVSTNSSIETHRVQSILEQLKPEIANLIAAGAGQSLADRIAVLERALEQSNPNVSVVRGLITDLRNTLTGAAGNLIASGAISALNMTLGTGVPG